jgi:hypothetical protein
MEDEHLEEANKLAIKLATNPGGRKNKMNLK